MGSRGASVKCLVSVAALGPGAPHEPQEVRASSLGYFFWQCGERAHSAGGPAAPLDVASRALRMHVRAGARLRPACVQAHNAHVPCGYAGGKPRVNLRGGRVGFGGRGPRRADL